MAQKNMQKIEEDLPQDWLTKEHEGQLAVDVYQTKDALIIKSTIAGVKDNDLEINVANDILTIRGERKSDAQLEERNYLYQECYWGKFSRSIVLPFAVAQNKIQAKLKDGVLTVILPRLKTEAEKVKINVQAEE